MKIEKLKSGNFRVRIQKDGIKYSLTFSSRPTKNDIQKELEARSSCLVSNTTFKQCCENYVKLKENILSPSTIREYKRLINVLSDSIASMDISSVNQLVVQNELNFYATTHSPKSCRNYHGFIASVLGIYKPQLVLKTTLPQKENKDPYIPTKEDVQAILDYASNTKYYIPFKLGCYGLRRGEIIALTIDDLDGNIIHINKDMVIDANKEWVVKPPKTTASTRDVYIDDDLRDRIIKQGYIYEGYPGRINQQLTTIQDRLGIKHFTFHKLRHYFASVASENLAEADVLALGGWQTPSVMKSVYRHSMNTQEKSKILSSKLF